MEKLTLSKIERFALVGARRELANAQDTFQQLLDDVAEAHGVLRTEAKEWQFSPDFSELRRLPKPPMPPDDGKEQQNIKAPAKEKTPNAS